MATVTYSALARDDMVKVWLWIATKAGIATADKVSERLERRIAMLGDNPMIGPSRPEIGEDARHLVCERWLALYRIKPDGVHVVRVVDGAQDLQSLPLWTDEQ